MNHFIIQIFCLINCAPLYTSPIKFGQLVSPIKWDNPNFNTDINVKIIPFFFSFHSFYFFSLLPTFFFFLFSMWLTLTRTLSSFVSCRNFSFLFGLFLYCLIVFLSFSQSFIVHCHKDSFCPIGPDKKLKLERKEQRSVHSKHRHHLSHQTPKF